MGCAQGTLTASHIQTYTCGRLPTLWPNIRHCIVQGPQGTSIATTERIFVEMHQEEPVTMRKSSELQGRSWLQVNVYPYMSYSLNSLKGLYIGDYIGDYYRGY